MTDVESVRLPATPPSSRGKDFILSVEGYKAIRERNQLRIAPLTIISGVNSSGKSSFMQPFLLMKQTLDSAFDPGPLLLHGPNVKITEYSQMFSRGKSRADTSTSFTAGMARGDFSRDVTFSARNLQIGIDQDLIRSPDGRIGLTERMSPSRQRKLREQYSHLADTYVNIFSEDETAAWSFEVSRARCFLELNVAIKTKDRTFRIGVTDEIARDDQWVDFLRGMIHVPGLRGNPERAYPRSAVGSTHPGTFETYVASVVYEWSNSRPGNHAGQMNLARLSGQLEHLGLTWKLSARKLNDASVELNVGRMPHAQQGGANDLVNVADVGFGVSQTLPVLVALLAARSGQVVYIEQPEIHLHPRAQLALADALVTAANRGVYVIAETHSSLVIRGIQTLIAEGNFNPRSLSLNWFGRDPQTGFQTITPADVDDSGRFGDWPLDFDEVSREADWAYLEAVDRKAGFGS